MILINHGEGNWKNKGQSSFFENNNKWRLSLYHFPLFTLLIETCWCHGNHTLVGDSQPHESYYAPVNVDVEVRMAYQDISDRRFGL